MKSSDNHGEAMSSAAGVRFAGTFPVPPLIDPDRTTPTPTMPDSTRGLLESVQGNILKGHGRDHQWLVFFRFGGSPAQNQQVLKDAILPRGTFAPWVTAAMDQKNQIVTARRARLFRQILAGQSPLEKQTFSADQFLEMQHTVRTADTQLFGTLMLSRAGLAALGCGDAQEHVPARDAFRRNWPGEFDRGIKAGMAGMVQGGEKITAHWRAPDDANFDGVFLLAAQDEQVLKDALPPLIAWCRAPARAATVLEDLTEKCATLRAAPTDPTDPNDRGLPREPFGFADGISVPKFFDTDRAGIDPTGPVPWEWTDLMLESVFITARESAAYERGSFVALVKFEQNVKAFHDYELSMIAELEAHGMPANIAQDLAGALLTGRNRAGNPLATIVHQLKQQPELFQKLFPDEVAKPAAAGMAKEMAGGFSREKNQFSFKDDQDAARCPFHAHIRKMNPRVDALGSLNKRGIIGAQPVRRGMAFDPDGKLKGADPVTGPWPDGGVGLMFMAYMNNLGSQFELLHNQWAWDAKFPDPRTGQLDPLLFSGDKKWKFGTAEFGPVPAFVTRVGGAYLFAPSIPWLENGGPLPMAPA